MQHLVPERPLRHERQRQDRAADQRIGREAEPDRRRRPDHLEDVVRVGADQRREAVDITGDAIAVLGAEPLFQIGREQRAHP
jgi:hypothetical protein